MFVLQHSPLLEGICLVHCFDFPGNQSNSCNIFCSIFCTQTNKSWFLLRMTPLLQRTSRVCKLFELHQIFLHTSSLASINGYSSLDCRSLDIVSEPVPLILFSLYWTKELRNTQTLFACVTLVLQRVFVNFPIFAPVNDCIVKQTLHPFVKRLHSQHLFTDFALDPFAIVACYRDVTIVQYLLRPKYPNFHYFHWLDSSSSNKAEVTGV